MSDLQTAVDGIQHARWAATQTALRIMALHLMQEHKLSIRSTGRRLKLTDKEIRELIK